MSDQAVLLSKWSPNGRIILTKFQVGHSYTFWTMPNMIHSPVANFGHHPLLNFDTTFYYWKSTKSSLLVISYLLVVIQTFFYLSNIFSTSPINIIVLVISIVPNQCSQTFLWRKKFLDNSLEMRVVHKLNRTFITFFRYFL